MTAIIELAPGNIIKSDRTGRTRYTQQYKPEAAHGIDLPPAAEPPAPKKRARRTNKLSDSLKNLPTITREIIRPRAVPRPLRWMGFKSHSCQGSQIYRENARGALLTAYKERSIDGDISQLAVNPPQPLKSNHFGAILVVSESVESEEGKPENASGPHGRL